MSGGARQARPAKVLHLMLNQCVKDLEGGADAKEVYERISELHGYSAAWLRSKHMDALDGLSVEAKPRGGVQSRIMDDELDTLLTHIVRDHTSYELAEMAHKLELLAGGLCVSRATISRALQRCGLTLKKKTTVQKAKYTQDNLEHTEQYIQSMQQRPAHTVCYFDETMVSSRDMQAGRSIGLPRAYQPSV
jgi:transposase